MLRHRLSLESQLTHYYHPGWFDSIRALHNEAMNVVRSFTFRPQIQLPPSSQLALRRDACMFAWWSLARKFRHQIDFLTHG